MRVSFLLLAPACLAADIASQDQHIIISRIDVTNCHIHQVDKTTAGCQDIEGRDSPSNAQFLQHFQAGGWQNLVTQQLGVQDAVKLFRIQVRLLKTLPGCFDQQFRGQGIFCRKTPLLDPD